MVSEVVTSQVPETITRDGPDPTKPRRFRLRPAEWCPRRPLSPFPYTYCTMQPRTATRCVPVQSTKMVAKTMCQTVPYTVTVNVPENRQPTGPLHRDLAGPFDRDQAGFPARVTRMVSEQASKQVPVTTCRMVSQVCTKQVPVTTCRMVSQVCTKQVPVTTCRMVSEVQTKHCPQTVCEMVPQECVKMVPQNGFARLRPSLARRRFRTLFAVKCRSQGTECVPVQVTRKVTECKTVCVPKTICKQVPVTVQVPVPVTVHCPAPVLATEQCLPSPASSCFAPGPGDKRSQPVANATRSIPSFARLFHKNKI